jgi:hypothetical protein
MEYTRKSVFSFSLYSLFLNGGTKTVEQKKTTLICVYSVHRPEDGLHVCACNELTDSVQFPHADTVTNCQSCTVNIQNIGACLKCWVMAEVTLVTSKNLIMHLSAASPGGLTLC